MSLQKSLASSSAIITFWSWWTVLSCLRKPACVVLSMECVSAYLYRVFVGGEACPELVKSTCKADRAI